MHYKILEACIKKYTYLCVAWEDLAVVLTAGTNSKTKLMLEGCANIYVYNIQVCANIYVYKFCSVTILLSPVSQPMQTSYHAYTCQDVGSGLEEGEEGAHAVVQQDAFVLQWSLDDTQAE